MKRNTLAVGLVVLVALAGCGALPGGSNGGTEATPEERVDVADAEAGATDGSTRATSAASTTTPTPST